MNELERTINELTTNPDYSDNVKEILALYFKANPDALENWSEWFKYSKDIAN